MVEYKPEGLCRPACELSPSQLAQAQAQGEVLQATALAFDRQQRLRLNLNGQPAYMEHDDCADGIDSGQVREIAVLTRVGRPTCFVILEAPGADGAWRLSRRMAQRRCREEYLDRLQPGDILPCRVTHIEPFGAFCDVGCGISALLPIDCLSVSRIQSPADRVQLEEDLFCVIKSRDDQGRLVLSLRELRGGIKEIVFSLQGEGAYSRLKFESGVHRVQRVPETETQGRIHTSTVTVAVMPEAEEVDLELDMNDLKIDTFRSSGAGGQHINKTSSAIRVTHLPTGMVVECQNERSQFQNKDKALEILRSRLLAQKKSEQQSAINAGRQAQVGSGDRSEKIRTYNFPQDRCTDHRIGLTVHNLDKVMDGGLDELLDALILHEQAEKLGALP